MAEGDWPPGPDNSSGVGLWWVINGKDLSNSTNLFQNVGRKKLKDIKPSSPLPALRVKQIQAPAMTLLLTEHARSNNLMEAASGAIIRSPTEHLDTSVIPSDKYHQGKFNYLMIDGHVETLSPPQGLYKNNPDGNTSEKYLGNIWTIRPDD
jgi:prepilin-type processing-associated H-X9-DG protein